LQQKKHFSTFLGERGGVAVFPLADGCGHPCTIAMVIDWLLRATSC